MSNRKLIILFAILAGVAAGYRLYTRPTAPATTPKRSSTDPNTLMPYHAACAVTSAAERGITLDYSPSSVMAVERILGQLHEDRVRGRLSDKDLNLAAMRYGGYIGEVLRRKYGGAWATDHEAAGPASFPIGWNGHDSFPVGWCGKRILNGDEDNVWFKYQVVTSDQGPGGAIALPQGGVPAKAE